MAASIALSVQLATSWMDQGSNSGKGEIFPIRPIRPRDSRTPVCFPGIKGPGRGGNKPPHLALRLQKMYSYTSTPLLDLQGPLQRQLYLFTCSYSNTILPFKIELQKSATK
jgi:hypothetical protein